MGHPTHDLQSKTKQIPVDKCTPPPNPEKKEIKSKNKWVGEGSGINKRRNKTKKHTIKLKINYASNIGNTN